ncbi:hypothetical protein JGU66_33365 [Myxococcaceae bacterium JPH2]|nr:hypothetical protein [Myxococcaceae bacterium JPH2]
MSTPPPSKISKAFAILCAVGVLILVMVTASISLMSGTKVRRLFGMSQEAMAGRGVMPSTGEGRVVHADAFAEDAGTPAPVQAAPLTP